MRKKTLALMLVLVLVVSVFPMASAAGTNSRSKVVAAGMSHSLAIKEDGTVWAWGTNASYQLGVPKVTEATTPVRVPGVTAAIAVAAGYDFSAALKYDGTVYTWGFGVNAEPVEVPGLTGVISIAAGQTTLLALKTDGTVWQWTYGQIPSQVPGLRRVAVISAGGAHFLALTCTGEVWAWGDNAYGQLGNGTKSSAALPVQASGLFDIVDISAGQSHSLAVTFNGTVYAWGSNQYNQLGGDDRVGDSAVPIEVKGLKDMTAVAAGHAYSLAINEKGAVYAWGYGEYGQLGNGATTITEAKPTAIGTSSGVATQIVAGVSHAMLVNDANKLFVWGRNHNYQVGNNKNGNAASPQNVLAEITAIGPYVTSGLDDISAWARTEVEPLYNSQLVPPVWWGNYTKNATRGEFAHLLVSVYEQIKNTTITVSKTTKFTDIEGHPLADDMKKAAQLEIVSGLSGGTLAAPDAFITRQEAVKMLCSFIAKINGTTVPTKLQSLAFYKDAADIDKWAAPYVYYAYENDIMKGGGGSFNPKVQISKQECLAVIARLAVQNKWMK